MIQQFISKLSQKEKKILVLAVVIFLLAILDRIFFGPALANLKSLEDEIRYKESSLKRDLRFLSYRDQILKEKDTLKRFYTKKQLTPGEIKEAFLNKIESLANQADLSSIRVSPTEGESKKGYTEYSASFECVGKLKDVLRFVHEVDSSNDLMKVVQFNIGGKKSSAEEVNASMTISTIIVALDPQDEITSPRLENSAAAESSKNNSARDLAAGHEAVPPTEEVSIQIVSDVSEAKKDQPPLSPPKISENARTP